MQGIAFAAAFMLSAILVHGSLEFKLLEPNPAFPMQCYDEEVKLAIGIGKSEQLKKPMCGKITCKKLEDKFQLVTAMCGAVSVTDTNCTIVEDDTRPYPDCCKKIVCPPNL